MVLIMLFAKQSIEKAVVWSILDQREPATEGLQVLLLESSETFIIMELLQLAQIDPQIDYLLFHHLLVLLIMKTPLVAVGINVRVKHIDQYP